MRQIKGKDPKEEAARRETKNLRTTAHSFNGLDGENASKVFQETARRQFCSHIKVGYRPGTYNPHDHPTRGMELSLPPPTS